jgi:hypothetical protein
MNTVQCRRCQGVIPENQATCPSCDAPVSGGEAGASSVFRKPGSASRLAQTPAPKATRASASSKTPSWIYIAAAIAGLVVLLVIGDIVSRAGRSRSVATAPPAPVTTPTPDDVPRKTWAIRLYSFEEIGAVRLPRVYAGAVRDYPSLSECEASIGPALQVTAKRATAKLPPGGGWGWRDEDIVRSGERLAFVWDGDRRRTYFGAWCVEE